MVQSKHVEDLHGDNRNHWQEGRGEMAEDGPGVVEYAEQGLQ